MEETQMREAEIGGVRSIVVLISQPHSHKSTPNRTEPSRADTDCTTTKMRPDHSTRNDAHHIQPPNPNAPKMSQVALIWSHKCVHPCADEDS
ncbi:hypothetical protein T265_09207 [Opisthorchis viverrini]|uniref:Uncharacterized protein n=1 Tax=Opisthorchis viverrini TaxID=6198 RepID=A0A074Z6R5_OPIVI|nr:hypothetical protein T265_09207 [Opisthorchis viverrini]KER22763.1 hypothetical protein T265_09207 [Opisthorchis viverrini]